MDQGEGCRNGKKWYGFERYLNVGIEQDFTVHWMQGDRALSDWEMDVDAI